MPYKAAVKEIIKKNSKVFEIPKVIQKKLDIGKRPITVQHSFVQIL